MENWNITSEEIYMDEAREQALLAEVAEEIELAQHEGLDVCDHEDAYLAYVRLYLRKFIDMDEF